MQLSLDTGGGGGGGDGEVETYLFSTSSSFSSPSGAREPLAASCAPCAICRSLPTPPPPSPSFGAMPPVLRWLSSLTPVSYAFEGLMLNENADQEFSPSLIGATGGNDGSVPLDVGGDAWMGAYQLPRSDFSWTSAKAFDICMVFLFVVTYDSLGERACAAGAAATDEEKEASGFP